MQEAALGSRGSARSLRSHVSMFTEGFSPEEPSAPSRNILSTDYETLLAGKRRGADSASGWRHADALPAEGVVGANTSLWFARLSPPTEHPHFGPALTGVSPSLMLRDSARYPSLRLRNLLFLACCFVFKTGRAVEFYQVLFLCVLRSHFSL